MTRDSIKIITIKIKQISEMIKQSNTHGLVNTAIVTPAKNGTSYVIYVTDNITFLKHVTRNYKIELKQHK